MRFIVDVTNAHDKECLVDIKKASITGKAMLTESELETMQSSRQNSTWLSTAWNTLCVEILARIKIWRFGNFLMTPN